jgi:hypothetical protein
MPGMRLWISR